MRTFLKTMRTGAWAVLLMLTLGALTAQGRSPWVDAVNELQTQFTGPIARGLALIAIVVGGLMFAFGEGGNKRTLAGINFGIGMAVGAVNFLGWLFWSDYGLVDSCAVPAGTAPVARAGCGPASSAPRAG